MYRATMLLAASSLALSTGCGARHTYFRPTERVAEETLAGDLVARYPVGLESGGRAEVRVWSPGVYRTRLGQRTFTALEVGIEIDNAGTRPIRLEDAGIEVTSIVTDDAGVISKLQPYRVVGSALVAPGEVGQREAIFELPGDLRPDDVYAFRVRWTAQVGEEELTELTPFVRDRRRVSWVPAHHYYDPWYPWYGVGWSGSGWYPYYGWYGTWYPSCGYPYRCGIHPHRRTIPRGSSN